MAQLLSGTAFITGAAQGIGLHTALAFARHGIQNLALADVHDEVLAESARSIRERYPAVEVLELHVDVRDESQVRAGISEVTKRFGRLDIAVNNAGIRGPYSDTDEVDEADWMDCISINLSGVWRCQKEELRVMKDQEDRGLREGRGKIINMASMFALSVPRHGVSHTAYTAAKHGVVGLTKADAVVYGRRGIRINAMCPGSVLSLLSDQHHIIDHVARFTRSPMLDGTLSKGDATALGSAIERCALSRMAETEEITDCITFLASPMSSFMQGALLVADGGFTLS